MAVTQSKPPVSPVLQFVLILIPIVMSGFYVVFTLAGIGLEGDYYVQWQLEAGSVALLVGGGLVLASLLVLLFARFKKLGTLHPLTLSGLTHLVLAIALTITVYVIAY